MGVGHPEAAGSGRWSSRRVVAIAVANTRAVVLARLLGELQQVRAEGRALVALDGFDGVGKSHLAQELVALAAARGGRPLARVSIDGFHHPKAERLRAGSGPDGFYRGSYRYDTFRECVVEPLREGRPIIPAVWDVAEDEPVDPGKITIGSRGILVVDGIFLQRSELTDVWDATVWVDAPFAVTVPRGQARFPGRHDPDPEGASNHRYVEGQRRYVREMAPRERATWIVDNTDLDHPTLQRSDCGEIDACCS